MIKDFTLDGYKNLLKSLKDNGYNIITVEDYFRDEKTESLFCIMRHDVDRRPRNALAMAKVEAKAGVLSTYYFRRSTFNFDIIDAIYQMGHGIGYHYEAIDRAKGNPSVAYRIFAHDLRTLRNYVDVFTCVAHGNPLTKWNNKVFWAYFDLSQFGLLGDAGQIADCMYFTDTGRNWQGKSNIKDFIRTTHHYIAKNTDKLIEFISTSDLSNLYFSAHPERWNDGWRWYYQWLFDLGCNQAKRIIKYASFAHKPAVSA